MSVLTPHARAVIESNALAHLVTVNPDGSPQVTCIWVGLHGEEIVSAHMFTSQRKLANIRRDPRVTMSLETDRTNDYGLQEYLVVHGTARIEEGGAPELLQVLARTYLGPDVVFPNMPDPPQGVRVIVTPTRIGGVGPWTEGE